MANQYMSLAKALHTYGEDVATQIGKIGDCSDKEIEEMNDLFDRGYRFFHLAAGSTSTDELPLSSKPEKLKLEKLEWDTIKKNIPYQTTLSPTCDEPEPEEGENDYGWSSENDSYFYSESFAFFGGRFGSNVYFEGINMNEQVAYDGEVVINMDDNLSSYNLGNGGYVVVGENGDPIVEFFGKDMVCYVDVHIDGKADAATLMGKGASTPTISFNPDYENDYNGSSC